LVLRNLVRSCACTRQTGPISCLNLSTLDPILAQDSNPYETPTSDLSAPASETLSRKGMVPVWIKVFGWIFIAITALSIPYMIWALFAGQPVRFELFGVSYIGPANHPAAFGMAALFAFMAITAYGLIFLKDWGVVGCLANGYVGLALCVITLIASGGTNIRLEPFILFFYLRRLHSIRAQWNEAGVS